LETMVICITIGLIAGIIFLAAGIIIGKNSKEEKDEQDQSDQCGKG